MERFLRILIILSIGSLGLSLATAEQVYKWVDDQGIIHYSEQAPGNKTATIIKIKSHEGQGKPQQLLAAETDNEVVEPRPEINSTLSKQQLAIQQQNCATARNKLQALQNAGRVRQLDPDSGEYVYLAEDVKLAQMTQMSDYLFNQCPD
jgi:hypothetical protein